STDVGERDLHTEVRLDELRSLPQRVAEAALRIVGSRRWRVMLRVGGLQHLDRFKCLAPGAMQDAVHGLRVHCLECTAQRSRGWISAHDTKSVYVADRDRRRLACKNTRQRSAQRDSSEWA